jgi:hypothetical protein
MTKITKQFQIDFGAVALHGSKTITFIDTNFPDAADRFVIWLSKDVAAKFCSDALKEVQGYYDNTHDMHLTRICSPPMERLLLARASYSNGSIKFSNGHHRTTALLRAGATIIPFDMDKDSLDALQNDGHRIAAWRATTDFMPALKPLRQLNHTGLDPVLCVYQNSASNSMRMADVVDAMEKTAIVLTHEIKTRTRLVATIQNDEDKSVHQNRLTEAQSRYGFLKIILPVMRRMNADGADWQDGTGYPFGDMEGSATQVAHAWLNTLIVPKRPSTNLKSVSKPAKKNDH